MLAGVASRSTKAAADSGRGHRPLGSADPQHRPTTHLLLPSRLPSTHTYVERARCRASIWSTPLHERPRCRVCSACPGSMADGRGVPRLNHPRPAPAHGAPAIPEPERPRRRHSLTRTSRTRPGHIMAHHPSTRAVRRAAGGRAGAGRRQERRPGRRAARAAPWGEVPARYSRSRCAFVRLPRSPSLSLASTRRRTSPHWLPHCAISPSPGTPAPVTPSRSTSPEQLTATVLSIAAPASMQRPKGPARTPLEGSAQRCVGAATLRRGCGPLRRSGPYPGQVSTKDHQDNRFRWSSQVRAVYHQHTKNLLVSYSPKKLGFFY